MAALTTLAHALIGAPEPLPRAVLDRYPELAHARWRRGGVFPRIAGICLGQRSVAGITFWRTVFLGADCRPTVELLLHELRHVQQFEQSPAFPLLYLWETLKSGYHLNRYERDARDWAAQRLRVDTDQGQVCEPRRHAP
jgi:hypothetical protein